MNYLSIIAIFKNESHILHEWIQHYIKEGVDHFYLINNGSTDEFETQLDSFIKTGFVTLIHDDKRWAQVELYTNCFDKYKHESEWFLICDLDEFIYSRRNYKTIDQFLRSLSSKTGLVQIPWKMFGSSGYTVQPKSVPHSFTLRCLYNKVKKETMRDGFYIFCKAILRSRYVKAIHIHFSDVGDSRMIAADKKKIKNKTEYMPISEKILKRSYLHLNHYPIQSLNWFMEVKVKRGDAHQEKYQKFRNLEYFQTYDSDSNEIVDNELSEKLKNL
ncbi:MAG: glycosyltransferase family 92 protein [Ekhidna sp.]|nr:glycosyltransferase family 92 protein [Ekhidna sp.]